MSAVEKLKDPQFIESLETMWKGYIEKQYREAGLEIPVPARTIPLEYADKRINKGLSQLRMGARIALYAYDQQIKKQG